MSKSVNQLRAGAMLSYANLALSSIIPFIYTPIMLRMLGSAEYGLYSLSHSAIAYLSLLSFGFGSTILRYLSMYRAKGDVENERKTFGFFLLVYCGVAVLVMIGGLIISFNIEPIFEKGLTVDELSKMRILVQLMAFSSAISFPISVFSSVTMAHEKYVFRKLMDMVATVIAPVGNLIALYMGFASVGMAVVSVIVQFMILPVNIYYCFTKLKIYPKFAIIPKEFIKEMLGFSVFVFMATLVDMLFWSTDKVLLGMFAGSTAVAVYNIGSTFNSMVTNLSTSLSSVLTPRITAMVTTDATSDELTELFIRVGRLQYIVVALIVSGFTVFGRAFVTLWAGEEFIGAYWVAIMTMFPLCIPLIQNTGLSIVTAQNKHHFRAIVYLIIAIANVVATYFAIPKWGGIGAAVCSGISYILGQGIVMNLYYWKVTKIDIPLFWKNIGKMSVVPGIMLGIGILMKITNDINNWITFFLGVSLYVMIYGGLMYKLSLNDYEKSVFSNMLRKIMMNGWI